MTSLASPGVLDGSSGGLSDTSEELLAASLPLVDDDIDRDTERNGTEAVCDRNNGFNSTQNGSLPRR